MRPIDTLVWHCTATPEGKDFTVSQIDKMHRDRGFKKIGYHGIIHLDGRVDPGRDESEVGAHVAGHNVGSIGYSYVGGVDANGKPKDTRTDAQKLAILSLTKKKIDQYKLKRVLGHRDFSPDLDGDGEIEPYEWIKVCPCFEVTKELGHLLKNSNAPPEIRSYTVKEGDTVWKIAREYSVTPQVIFAANPFIGENAIIHPGQVLGIPRV